jgi:hypothetical protein
MKRGKKDDDVYVKLDPRFAEVSTMLLMEAASRARGEDNDALADGLSLILSALQAGIVRRLRGDV